VLVVVLVLVVEIKSDSTASRTSKKTSWLTI